MTVVKLGTGIGTVTANSCISSGSKCTAAAQAGFIITFTAHLANGSTFTGWQGACAGVLTPTCNVTASGADQLIAAVFDAAAKGGGGSGGGGSTFTLSVGRRNLCTVTSDIGGLNCGSNLLGQVRVEFGRQPDGDAGTGQELRQLGRR